MTFHDHLVERKIKDRRTSGNRKHGCSGNIILTVDHKIVGLAGHVADSITSSALVRSIITKIGMIKAQD